MWPHGMVTAAGCSLPTSDPDVCCKTTYDDAVVTATASAAVSPPHNNVILKTDYHALRSVCIQWEIVWVCTCSECKTKTVKRGEAYLSLSLSL